MYLALMSGFIADFQPVTYALFSALVLALGLVLQTSRVGMGDKRVAQPVQSVIPNLSDSMAELHALQSEINELQAQFAAEQRQLSSANPHGSAS